MDNCKNFQKIIIVCKYTERKNRHERSKDTEKAVYFLLYCSASHTHVNQYVCYANDSGGKY